MPQPELFGRFVGRRPRGVWKTASVARKSTCSKRLPEYWRERPEPWSVFWAAGMITSASARRCERGTRVGGERGDPRAGLAAVSAALTTPEVVPDPEATSSRSPERMAGVVVSPATWTVRPRCISRMAAIRRTRPLRPAPGDEDPVGQPERASQGGQLLLVELGRRVR